MDAMVIDMNEAQVRTVEQMRQVLQGTDVLEFRVAEHRSARYSWVGALLHRVGYRKLKRVDRGLVREYLQRLGGYSRAQATRLISRWMNGETLATRYRVPEHAFMRYYTPSDVAALLDKLRVEFTRSRPRRCNDNALVESKNGAVVRKVFGYEHIPQHHAQRFNAFCIQHLNPFLNFHRPCLFVTERPDPSKPGRTQRVYRPKDAMTPLDKLASLADVDQYLRNTTLAMLQQRACVQTDLNAAHTLNRARDALFKAVRKAA